MPGDNQITLDFTGPLMTGEEQRVLAAIKGHVGKAAAIKGKRLAAAIGMNYDEMREVISHLVIGHKVRIASCGKGYFLAQTPEEIREASRSLKHRGIMVFLHASCLEDASLEEVFHQARMDYEKAS
jgi:hypothetical protein